MKHFLILLLVSCWYDAIDAQPYPYWTWIDGDNRTNVWSKYYNEPPMYEPGPLIVGSRYGHSTVVDNVNQILYVLGGLGYNDYATQIRGLSDLWAFNLTSRTWSLGGYSVATLGDIGHEHILGIYRVNGVAMIFICAYQKTWTINTVTWQSTDLTPSIGSCGGISFRSFVFDEQNAILYGYSGSGADWKDDLVAYRVLTGTTQVLRPGNPDQLPVYGQKGVAAPGNTPGSRWSTGMTVDSQRQRIYMWGGVSGRVADMFQNKFCNDLWMLDLSTNWWTWISGDQYGSSSQQLGERGVPGPLVRPGVDESATNEFVVRRFVFDADSQTLFYYDNQLLWSYSVNLQMWAWIAGDSNTAVRRGTKGVSSSTNFPGLRTGSSLSFSSRSKRIYLFGGDIAGGSSNEMWALDAPVVSPYPYWTWFHGDNRTNVLSKYFSQFWSDPFIVGSRSGSNIAIDTVNQVLYLTGGALNSLTPLNDIWAFNLTSRSWAALYNGTGGIMINSTRQPLTLGNEHYMGVYQQNAMTMMFLYTKTGIFVFNTASFQWRKLELKGNGGFYGTFTWFFENWVFDDRNATLYIFNLDCDDGLYAYYVATESFSKLQDGYANGCDGPIYGTKGVPDIRNTPDARYGAGMVVDSLRQLIYLWGGDTGDYQLSNDLWMFNIKTKMWTWLSGDQWNMYEPQTNNATQILGSLGMPGPDVRPGKYVRDAFPYFRQRFTFDDHTQTIFYFDDQLTWSYSVVTNMWTWIAGDPGRTTANYGQKGVSLGLNSVGLRKGSSLTFDPANKRLFMFGGCVVDGCLNDLWVMDPQIQPCATCSVVSGSGNTGTGSGNTGTALGPSVTLAATSSRLTGTALGPSVTLAVTSSRLTTTPGIQLTSSMRTTLSLQQSTSASTTMISAQPTKATTVSSNTAPRTTSSVLSTSNLPPSTSAISAPGLTSTSSNSLAITNQATTMNSNTGIASTSLSITGVTPTLQSPTHAVSASIATQSTRVTIVGMKSNTVESIKTTVTDPSYSYECRAGFTINGTSTDCVPCLANTYKPTRGNQSCIPCPSYASCNNVQFTCNVGFTIDNSVASGCSMCGSNTYKSSVGNQPCLPCPEHADCTHFSFQCKPGYNLTENNNCVSAVPKDGERNDSGWVFLWRYYPFAGILLLFCLWMSLFLGAAFVGFKYDQLRKGRKALPDVESTHSDSSMLVSSRVRRFSRASQTSSSGGQSKLSSLASSRRRSSMATSALISRRSSVLSSNGVRLTPHSSKVTKGT